MSTPPNHQRKVEWETCIDPEMRQTDYTADKSFEWACTQNRTRSTGDAQRLSWSPKTRLTRKYIAVSFYMTRIFL
jgi:hypothetical protein